jgi:DNA-binding CsgD family transcriptional regulator
LVHGEPGIGKTTLATNASKRARRSGVTVVQLHVGRPETSMSFSALGDLLDTVPDDVREGLAPPLRDAIAITMLRTPGEEVGQDPRAVALASLAVVRRLAATGPLLLVIDDLQWLDVSSAQVLSFVLQRLEREPVGILATLRDGEAGSAPLDVERDLTAARLDRLELGPMPTLQFGRMLRARVSPSLPRSLVLQIHEAVEGNPFFGLELAREVVRHGAPEPGAPLPVSRDALALVRHRLSQLSEGARSVLTVAALASRPTVTLLCRALPDVDVTGRLAEAEQEALVSVRHGHVAFEHAIFASALVSEAPPPRRRHAHRLLARASESPEEHARHLALSSLQPSASVADALTVAQVAARRRGAATAAAELATLAHAFTPDDRPDARFRRAVTAGLLAFEGGDALNGQETLRRLVAEMPPGPKRAEVMVTLCEICWQDTVEIEGLTTAALVEPDAGPHTVAGAHLMLAWVAVYRGRLDDATGRVDRAAKILEQLDPDPATRSDLLTVAALTAFLVGRPHRDLIEEAERCEELAEGSRTLVTTTVYSDARVTRGLIELLGGELGAARSHLEAELDRLARRGRYVARDEILCYLAHVACQTGAWSDAARFAEECLEIGVESGHRLGRGQNLLPWAWLAAVRGDLDAARAAAEEGLELSVRYRDEFASATARRVLGLVALSEGDVTTALERLRPMLGFLAGSGGCWPMLASGVADAIEALVATGMLEEAEAVASDDRLTCRAPPWQGQASLVARGAAALAAARGDLDTAATVLTAALNEPALAQQPFEQARAFLKAGELERRRRLRSRARAHLERAVQMFSGLGASVWQQRAAAELARLNGYGGRAGLTPTEAEVVRLVASGLKNRELAGTLFVSVKTVEATLSRIYRKTGSRSRQELVRWWLSDANALP